MLANRIVAVMDPHSAPVERMIKEARKQGLLIDATYGRPMRSLIVTDIHLILSSLLPETFRARYKVDTQ